ncbi:MAG: peptidoglycan recognition protein family protein [Planctomycetes bacterium]|nr:peptidoglycan recognition protein family protein [Planctomycetota bacterium]
MATIEHLSSDSLGRARANRRTGPARLAWLCALSWLLAACATTAGPRPRAYAPPTAVTSSTILQPPALPTQVELDYLARAKTPAALLRRAWLELLVRRPQAALDSAAQVLYGPFPPSANDESFARYLRAQAWTQLGKAERGQYDRERAAELAMDVELRRLLLADSAPAEASAPKLASLDLALQDRATWKARAVVRKELKPMTPITRLTIHHSAMYFRDTRPAACAAQILRIQHEHMQGRGYGDIGYHFLIDPSGRIWKGRGLEWQGAHADGDNNVGNVGICLLGNFLRGRSGQGPTAAQVESMQRLVVGLMRKYRIDAEAIYCHKDLKPTECPGPLMVPVVNQMVRELQRHGTARFADLAAGL